MNSPGALHLLVPASAELVSRVPLFPDETTFSYVNRICLLTGAGNRKSVVADLFGNPATRTGRPLHAGFGHFAALFVDASGVQPVDLPQRHSMIALFAPFADKDRYRRGLALIHGNRANGINEVVGQRPIGVFRESPAVCPECIRDDIETHSVAYHRRLHQVSAVTVCPNHGTALLSSCPSCGSRFSFERQPELRCLHCHHELSSEQPIFLENSASALPHLRLTRFVDASLSGKLPWTDVALRLSVLQERTARKVASRSEVIGANLARFLTQAFGRDYLTSIGLATDAPPTLAWPALFINGRLAIYDPIANCIAMAALFESVEDYLIEVNRMRLNGAQPPAIERQVSGSSMMSIGVLKDVLRPMLLEDVASKHGIGPGVLRKWVAAMPGLSQHRQKSGNRVRLRTEKKLVLDYLGRNPGVSRSHLARNHKGTMAYIFRHDRRWLEIHLPTRSNLSGSVVKVISTLSPDNDSKLAEHLKLAVAREKASLARPKRLYRHRVWGMSGIQRLSNSAREDFPLTKVAVEENIESVESYYQRALVWAYQDLRRCFGSCQSIIELFVHAKVGVRYVKQLEPFARRLLEPTAAGLA